tara:strand:- start:7394 stop:7939 length:546 start_codon:yes stop_codon:yes gene_type:complete
MRKNTLHESRAISGPKFKLAVPLFFPVTIHVDQKIEAAKKPSRRVSVEVHMNSKHPSSLDSMNTATHVLGISDEIASGGHICERSDESIVIQSRQSFSNNPWLTDECLARLRRSLSLSSVDEVVPRVCVCGLFSESIRKIFSEVLGPKVVENHVLEWVFIRVLLAQIMESDRCLLEPFISE